MPLTLPALKRFIALLHYFVTIVNVGLARIRHKIAATAIVGALPFQRA